VEKLEDGRFVAFYSPGVGHRVNGGFFETLEGAKARLKVLAGKFSRDL